MAAGPASPCPTVSSTSSSPFHLPAFKKRKTDCVEEGLGGLESMEGVQEELGCMEGVGGGEVVEEVENYLLCSLSDVGGSSIKASIDERRALLGRPEEDAEELFGRHIAANLRRLTNRQKAEAKVRIQQVMIEVEFPKDLHNSPAALF